LQFLLARLKAEHYDVLLPVHDQVFPLARFRNTLGRLAGLPVPDFATVERLQSKAAFLRVLEELRLPHPRTVLVRTRKELEQACICPCYIKLPYSTAGCGVWPVRTAQEAAQTAGRLEQAGLLTGETEVLVQEAAPGILGVVQTVFQHGRLIAGHCYQARALGVGSSARARVSAAHPLVLEHIAALGAYLRWHGALTLDYLWDTDTCTPSYIDANPRLGETLNATLSGVNLCELLVQVALDRTIAPPPPSRVDVKTHSVLMTLLAHGQNGASRGPLLRELWHALRKRGLYAGSQDEITRPRDDPLSLIPAAFLSLRLLINPRTAASVIAQTVDNYSLSEPAARAIRELTEARVWKG
jgi:predicted ATP-grasp superfamily ATP-dependent carboligase